MTKRSKSGKARIRVGERMADYRLRTERGGLKRVETTVSVDDVLLMKDIARVLRAGGPVAADLRNIIQSALPARQAQTGRELLAILNSGIVLSEDEEKLFDVERDRSSGRSADFE